MVENPLHGRMNSLLAAAEKLTGRILRSGSPKSSRSLPWQEDAWEMYDLVGEQRFLATTLAGRMSQAKFYVGEYSDSSMDVPEETDNPAARSILESVGAGDAGRRQLVFRAAVNLFIAGDCWMVGIPRHLMPFQNHEPPEDGQLSIEDLEWRVLSVSEVSFIGDRALLTLGMTSEELLEVAVDDVWMLRVWRPHPRRYWEADSPTRSSLPVLRELVGLTMHISAQVDSRLAGAGLLVVPQSAQRSLNIAAGLDETDDTDPFTEALLEAMIEPINNRSSASALVPLVVTVPDEVTGAFEYITFSKPLDTEARSLRDEAIRRLALGQDAPPELLLGTAGMNHWGAWLVREDVVTTHLEPPLALICDALTTQFLWPVLESQGMEEDEYKKFVIWYDIAQLIAKPNRAGDAMNLYERGAVSEDTLRIATGFDDTDAPTVEDEVSKAVFEMVKANPALIGEPGIDVLREQMTAILTGDSAAPAEASPSEGAVPPETSAPAERPADGMPEQDTTSPSSEVMP